MIRRSIPLVLDTLSWIALGLWLGGLVFCWMTLAPFLQGGHSAALSRILLESLRRYSVLIEVCGLILVGTQWLLRRRYQREKSRFLADGARFLLTFAAYFLAEYCRYSQIPRQIQDSPPGGYVALQFMGSAQVLLLLGVTGLTVWLQQGAVRLPAKDA